MYIDERDISKMRFNAFHITGSLDDCVEIKNFGLKNLQLVLSSDTDLSRVLHESGLWIDIMSRELNYLGYRISIDYDRYNEIITPTDLEKRIKSLARRIYKDYCIDGFFCIDNPFSYGTGIHKRPEFFQNIVALFPELEIVERRWLESSKSYKVNFFAYYEQIQRLTFGLDCYDDPPCYGWVDLTDVQKLKKWMLSRAIYRVNNELGEKYIFIMDETSIPPEQIISCEHLG